MFIHWGVYSVPAGEHNGQATRGNSEWIMKSMKIPIAEYKQYAARFNPVKYDPDAWVRMARDAGMKYIVITSKHHDGFALFDSAASDWNVVDATPYGKDLLKPLERACNKYGLKLGFYYSQAQDWVHPGGSARGGEWDPAHRGDMDEYIDKIAVPQVRELLTNYDISMLWWDTCDGMTFARADRLLAELDSRPDLITNSRLICAKHCGMPRGTVIPGKYQGDFTTAERHVPATGLDRDYENCQTMQRSWGYNKVDKAWKTPQSLIRNLIENASKGGNFLLNVGPKADGTFPVECVERLEAVGAWMRVNGETIYGTTASPFAKTPWGRCSQKALPGGHTRIYLHVYDWPTDGELRIEVLRNEAVAARVLGSTAEIEAQRVGDGMVLRGLPGKPVHDAATVVALDIVGKPVVLSVPKAALRAASMFDDGKFGGIISRGASYRLSSGSRYDQPAMHAALLAGKAYKGEFAFHTGVEAAPYIEIDLGRAYKVNGLKIVNRRTAVSEWRNRAANLYVEVSTDGKAFTREWTATGVQDQWDALLERFNAGGGDIGVPARYVRIGAEPEIPAALHLYAVTVYGEE